MSGTNKKIILMSVALTIPFAVWFGRTVHEEKQPPGGTLYVGLEIPYYNLDVLNSGGLLHPEMTIMNNLMLERLFSLGPSGNIVPELGLSAQMSDDGKRWDIELRSGVVFHDKSPFNADAVVAHWQQILNPKNKFRGRALIEPIRDVQKINDHRVRFYLKHPWGAFLNVISDEIHSFAYIPALNNEMRDDQEDKSVGTGPFIYDNWNHGDHFSVVKNPHYWKKGEPYLEKIVFRQIPDPQTRYAALISNQVDAITADRGTIIKKANQNENLKVIANQGNGAEIVLINTTTPPLNDARVRRALAYANDQKIHVRLVYHDSIPVVHHPYGRRFDCARDDYPEHSLERAKALINEYGRPVEIECMHSSTLRGRNTGEILQQLFKHAGLDLKPVPMDTGGVIQRVFKRNYQLTTWRIPSSRDHGPRLYRDFHSKSPANFSGYKNTEMDALLEAQRIELDPYKRRQMLCEIAGLLNRDVPFFYRGGRRIHFLLKKKVEGIETAGEMLDLSTAWIKGLKSNPWGRMNELAAKDPIDCSDPGDIEAVKSGLLGSWKGRDNYGAIVKGTFYDNGTVKASRNDRVSTSKYTVCGNTVFWRPPGALLIVNLENDQLIGHWEYSGYKGNFTLERVASKTVGN